MKNRNMKKDLDVMLAGLTLSPERRDAILREANRKHHPFRFAKGKILLASALIAALSVSAYAISPTMQETIKGLLGGLYGQSQTITDAASEYDGIEVRPVSALADKNFVRIFCEVQDKTGDRLAEAMDIGYHIDGLFDKGGTEHSPEVVSYDEKTHTALLYLQATGLTLTEPTDCTISFSQFTPADNNYRRDWKYVGSDYIRNTLPSEFPENLKTKAVETYVNSDGEPWYHKDSVVLPEQNPMPLDAETLDGDYARISSVGFGDDGCFHLLTAYSGKANHEHSGMSIHITDTRTGEGLCSSGGSYFIDGTWYDHAIYEFGPEDLPYMEFGDLHAFYAFRDTIHGDWSVDVTIEPVGKAIIYKPNTMVYNVLLEEVQVTPLSVTAITNDECLPDKRRDFFRFLNARATLRDGTELDLSDNKITYSSYAQWTFDEPIDPADLVSLTFGRDQTVYLADDPELASLISTDETVTLQ